MTSKKQYMPGDLAIGAREEQGIFSVLKPESTSYIDLVDNYIQDLSRRTVKIVISRKYTKSRFIFYYVITPTSIGWMFE